ncbi:hypothetical protein ACFC1T_22470 [Kitasatospora sp. NPDC056076]|uniref:hypothetical protein n=1 Tax=Kitasatospora sp. NPDC056076 TaxID=3345703 RepID=UPI0035D67D8F
MWWDAELHCPPCDLHLCEHAGPEAMPTDVRAALLAAHGPARLRLSGPPDDPLGDPPGDPVAALRVLRDGAGVTLREARELLDELREFGMSGTAVEMAWWQVRLAERGVAAEVEEGFGRAYRYVGPPELYPSGPRSAELRPAGMQPSELRP